MDQQSLQYQNYTAGWVCALPNELAAATVMLDVRHSDLPRRAGDKNTYTLGSIGGHNVAIACLPAGDIGNNPAATVATRMTSTFPSIRFWLMVGIGGGVPPKVRLGDIVISTPVYHYPGLVQWDLGIEEEQGFRRIGALDKAPEVLRSGITKLRAHRDIFGPGVKQILEKVGSSYGHFAAKYLRSDHLKDELYSSDYKHVHSSEGTIRLQELKQELAGNGDSERYEEQAENLGCQNCDPARIIRKSAGEPRVMTHFGVIASGNAVVKSTEERDDINQQRMGGHALCFEMEAAGIASSHPCLVIRGICDYADTHKNYEWQNYAAAVAAAFAKELLGFVTPEEVEVMPRAAEVLDGLKNVKDALDLNRDTMSKIELDFVMSKLPAVPEAAFDSLSNQSEPYCHPESRTALLSEITAWAHEKHGKCIFWLNGMAGTGKSTISRTVARNFSVPQLLGASFFFKRGEADRGNAAKFLTTIVSQLVHKIPELALSVKHAVESDSAIYAKTMKEQFETLLFNPLEKLATSQKMLVVVDALDECENEGHIRMILHLLARFAQVKSVHMRFLLTSRPELPIRLGFKQNPESHQEFILHEVPGPVIEHDIRVYLRDELPAIRDAYNKLPPSGTALGLDWPSVRSMDRLVQMAVPLFIFAATMCRFIADDFDWDPAGKLLNVLRYQSKGGFDQLEQTYLPVLNQLAQGQSSKSEKEARIEEFRDIVGSIVILFEPLSTASLAKTLGITKGLIDKRLYRLHSVLRIPEDPKQPVRPFHLSFRDFLVDPARKESPFWVDEAETHRSLAFRCIKLLSKTPCLKENICSLEKFDIQRTDIDPAQIEESLPAEVQYACRYWVNHLEKGGYDISEGDEIHLFLEKRFLYWLEALSLIGSVRESVSMIELLQNLVKPAENTSIRNFLKDAKRFVLRNKGLLDSFPMQLYSSAIIFCPETSIIKRKFQRHVLKWLKRLPMAQNNWDDLSETIACHDACIETVVFSPDGRHFASGSNDATVKLWTAVTGHLEQILEGHTGPVYSIAFSGKGTHIASTSRDQTIKIWDVLIGDIQQSLEIDDFASSIAFLPDETQLAVGSSNGMIKIWNIITCELEKVLGLPFDYVDPRLDIILAGRPGIADQGTLKSYMQVSNAEYFSWLHPMAVSADGAYIISSYNHREPRIWIFSVNELDNPTGFSINEDFALENVERSPVLISIAITTDCKTLAFGYDLGYIKVVEFDTHDVRHTLGRSYDVLESGQKDITTVAFWPNRDQLASGSRDGTVKIWDSVSGTLLRTCSAFTSEICSIAFSPNGERFISASVHGTVAHWDIELEDLHLASDEDIEPIPKFAFSSNGSRLISGMHNIFLKRNIFQIWDAATGGLKQIIRGRWDDLEEKGYSPDGYFFIVTSCEQDIGLRISRANESWDTRTDVLEAPWPGPTELTLNRSASDTCTDAKFVKIWSTSTAELRLTFVIYSDIRPQTTFSMESKRVAMQSAARTLEICDLKSCNGHCVLETSEDIVKFAFSHDSEKIAIMSAPGALGIWIVMTGKLVQTINCDFQGPVSIMFSPDNGRILANSPHDEKIEIWNIITGELLRVIECPDCDEADWRMVHHKGTAYLQTSEGLFNFQEDKIDAAPETDLWTESPNLDENWIALGEERIIWLPSRYQSIWSDGFDMMLAVGTELGFINLYEFVENPTDTNLPIFSTRKSLQKSTKPPRLDPIV